jgi:hypothetical protein
MQCLMNFSGVFYFAQSGRSLGSGSGRAGAGRFCAGSVNVLSTDVSTKNEDQAYFVHEKTYDGE